MYFKGLVLAISSLLMMYSLSLGQAYSTLQGGPWSAPSTWKDGVVPGSSDDIVIVGPVQIDAGGDYYVHSLKVEPGGKLQTVVSIPTPHFYVTQDVVNEGLIEGKGNLTPLYFTIGGGLINLGQWKTHDVSFPDTLQHLFRCEPGSYFNATAVKADNATLISDRDVYLYGVEFRAFKLILNRDYVTSDTTTFYFKQGSTLKIDNLFAQDNAIAGDNTSTITEGMHTFTPNFWDVHIRGETQVTAKMYFWGSVVIEDTLRLPDGWASSFKMVTEGDLINRGYVIPNDQNEKLYFECKKGVTNYGYFDASEIEFTGQTSHYLSSDPNAVFKPTKITGFYETVISNGDIRIDEASVDLVKLILQPGDMLFLVSNPLLSLDTLIGNNNTIKTPDAARIGGYYKDNIYRDVSFQGTILLTNQLVFEGKVVNNGIMQVPNGTSTSQKVTIHGNFVNKGSLARNDNNYGIFIEVDGSIDNQGTWDTYKIKIPGTSHITLATDTTQTFHPGSIDGFQGSITSASALRIDNASVIIDSLILQPGHALILNQHTTLAIRTLLGNGNAIRSNSAYTIAYNSLHNPQLKSVTLYDTVMFSNNTDFFGDIVNQGVMQVVNGSSVKYTLTFFDNISNFGSIMANDKNTKLRIQVAGNLENAGFWSSDLVKLNGHSNQKINVPDSSKFLTSLQILAMRNGGIYQWEKNGVDLSDKGHISGAKTSTLVFSRVTPADSGIYRCRIDSSGQTIFSRDVMIANTITDISTPHESEKLPQHFALEQNFPNPFNPLTTIRYRLPRSVKVKLVLYDVLGRKVRELVNHKQPAGYYQIKLNAANLSSGIYFYRLQAGEFVQVRKMLIQK